MNEEASLSPLGRAALEYVKRGFSVIALAARDKKPATSHGLNDWTDNPKNVIEWWTEHPESNVGIVCGQPSHGLLVLDIDMNDEDGDDGYATMRKWETTNGTLPETVAAITGSGGMHYLYRVDREIRPSVNADSKIDIRCDGSYIVAPPSIHPNGREYVWETPPDEMEVADADANVYALVDSMQRNGEMEDGTKKPNGKFRLPDRIKSGERDRTLFRYASHLRAIGRTDEEIMLAVSGANLTLCDVPLEKSQIKKIVKSACAYQQGESDEREVGRPGAKAEQGDGQPWMSGKSIIHNLLARDIIEKDMACLIGGAPAIWTGTRWDMGSDAIARACLRREDGIKTNVRNEVINYILLDAEQKDVARDFDGRAYVQFTNGTFDSDGVEVTPTPEMLITNQLPVAFDMDAEDAALDAFLDSISDGDAPTRRLMCQAVAACMCSMRIVDQSLMLIGKADVAGGEASNGKSTYLNMLRALLGHENVSTLDISGLGEKFQRRFLVGRLANIGDDIPNGFLQGQELSIFKKMVTGDEVFADVKGANGFSFTPQATLVFSMNEVPRLGDTSEGIYRRLALMPFRRAFRKGDPGYNPRMLKEITTDAALMRMASLGMRELNRLEWLRGFDPVPDMEAEVAEIKRNNDSVLRWIYEEDIKLEDIVYESPGRPGRLYTEDVFNMYKNWCVHSGLRFPTTLATFSRRLKANFSNVKLEVDVRKMDKISKRCYVVKG